MTFPSYTLVTRTPHLLAYEVRIPETPHNVTGVLIKTLEEDASGWRDRPIHRLVATRVTDDAGARRLLQGVGLINHSAASVMRGRLSLTPVRTRRMWGVDACHDNGRAAIVVSVSAALAPGEDVAIVTLEIEQNR